MIFLVTNFLLFFLDADNLTLQKGGSRERDHYYVCHTFCLRSRLLKTEGKYIEKRCIRIGVCWKWQKIIFLSSIFTNILCIYRQVYFTKEFLDHFGWYPDYLTQCVYGRRVQGSRGQRAAVPVEKIL